MSKVLVFGHKNPDNDAIMSAVMFAQLANAIDGANNEYVACRLGGLPGESAALLAEVGMPEPELLEKLRALRRAPKGYSHRPQRAFPDGGRHRERRGRGRYRPPPHRRPHHGPAYRLREPALGLHLHGDRAPVRRHGHRDERRPGQAPARRHDDRHRDAQVAHHHRRGPRHRRRAGRAPGRGPRDLRRPGVPQPRGRRLYPRPDGLARHQALRHRRQGRLHRPVPRP